MLCSVKEIVVPADAGAAFLGEATIKTYVGSILMKLGCRDRVQAVVAAYEAGLVQPRQHG